MHIQAHNLALEFIKSKYVASLKEYPNPKVLVVGSTLYTKQEQLWADKRLNLLINQFNSKSIDYYGLDLQTNELSQKHTTDVTNHPYIWHLEEDFFNLIICQNVLEHVENPFEIMAAMTQHLAVGGILFITTPCRWPNIHRYPIDCWRILPDGYETLIKASFLLKLDVREVLHSPENPKKSKSDVVAICQKLPKTVENVLISQARYDKSKQQRGYNQPIST